MLWCVLLCPVRLCYWYVLGIGVVVIVDTSVNDVVIVDVSVNDIVIGIAMVIAIDVVFVMVCVGVLW